MGSLEGGFLYFWILDFNLIIYILNFISPSRWSHPCSMRRLIFVIEENDMDMAYKLYETVFYSKQDLLVIIPFSEYLTAAALA